MSNVISLQNKKQLTNRQKRSSQLDTDTRLRELEEDVLRLIDHSLELEEKLSRQTGIVRKLLRLLKKAKTEKLS